MRYAQYVEKYSRKSEVVHLWHVFLILKSILRRGPRIFLDFFWFVRSNKIPLNYEQDKKESTPPPPIIELLIVATEKDFDLLRPVILNALSSSLNQICELKIVVPSFGIESCHKVLSTFLLPLNLKVQILNEESVLDLKTREFIKFNSDGSYGWLLQQFIKLKMALESDAGGILVVDADTIILGKNVWLDSSGKQKLVAAATRHTPYFDFLKDLNILNGRPRYSFVVHHMLYQPKILKKLLEQMNCSTFEEFSQKVLRHKGTHKVSSLSIDYELYGQFLFEYFGDLIHLQRFSNLSLPRNFLEQVGNEGDADRLFSDNYNSISLHSWNFRSREN